LVGRVLTVLSSLGVPEGSGAVDYAELDAVQEGCLELLGYSICVSGDFDVFSFS
jgi:hypothetical protein